MVEHVRSAMMLLLPYLSRRESISCQTSCVVDPHASGSESDR